MGTRQTDERIGNVYSQNEAPADVEAFPSQLALRGFVGLAVLLEMQARRAHEVPLPWPHWLRGLGGSVRGGCSSRVPSHALCWEMGPRHWRTCSATYRLSRAQMVTLVIRAGTLHHLPDVGAPPDGFVSTLGNFDPAHAAAEWAQGTQRLLWTEEAINCRLPRTMCATLLPRMSHRG